MFFIDQPEILNTINIIPGFLYKDFPITGIIGALFVFFILFFWALKKKYEKIQNNFYKIAIFLILIAWIPLYFNYFLINFFDFKADFIDNESLRDHKHQHISRICNIDYRQSIKGIFCKIYPFSSYLKEMLPFGAKTRLLSYSGLEPYFYYNIYPHVNFVYDFEKADYVILHYSQYYSFKKDNILYKKDYINNIDIPIGEFSVVGQIGDSSRVILKKTKLYDN